MRPYQPITHTAIRFTIFYYSILICCSCSKIDDPTKAATVTDHDNQIEMVESDSLFTLSVNQNLAVDMEVFYPNAKGPLPSIVVLHGCGGLYSDAESRKMESHFLQWIQWGRENKVIMLFIDSYNPRGFSEFCNMAPPQDAVCSPAYERPKDIFAALNWLYAKNYVDTAKIGLLGFSHGGSTALASIIDYNYVKKDMWTVSGTEAPAPVNFGKYKFAAAVAYYPGCGFYGYFGSTTNPNSGKYLPNTPILIHAAALDPLYTNGSTEVLVEKARLNGASDTTQNPIELVIYEGASHSFDGKTSGADAQASTLAMKRTTDWFIEKMKL